MLGADGPDGVTERDFHCNVLVNYRILIAQRGLAPEVDILLSVEVLVAAGCRGVVLIKSALMLWVARISREFLLWLR
jgi:hypothetical protein